MNSETWAKLLPAFVSPYAAFGALVVAYWGIYKTKLSGLIERTIMRLVAKMQNSPIGTPQISAGELLQGKEGWEKTYPKQCSLPEIQGMWLSLANLEQESTSHKYWLLLSLMPLIGIALNVCVLFLLPTVATELTLCSWELSLPIAWFLLSVTTTVIFILQVVVKL